MEMEFSLESGSKLAVDANISLRKQSDWSKEKQVASMYMSRTRPCQPMTVVNLPLGNVFGLTRYRVVRPMIK